MRPQDRSIATFVISIPVGVDPSYFGYPELNGRYLARAGENLVKVRERLDKDYSSHYCEIYRIAYVNSHVHPVPLDVARYGLFLYCGISTEKVPERQLKTDLHSQIPPEI